MKGRAVRAASGVLLVALAAWGYRTWSRPINVVLIGIDTLRADHLGCYGYPRPTSPRIDALAEHAMVFEHAISQSPWTLPAFASILTGVLPQRHGAGQGKECLLRPCGSLALEQPTLAEVFARAGYRTASFVSNGFVGTGTGLERGFEQTGVGIFGIVAVERAVRWLEEHRSEPVFLFVHVIEPHVPYVPPPADAAPFLDPAYDGPIGMHFDYASIPKCRTEADRRRAIDLYDGEVRVADGLTGRILDALSRLGMDRRTLVAVVADHGEELFERGTVGHGHTLYDELIRVPLVIRHPGGTPRGRIGQQVRTMDLFPTLLDAAGIPVPSGLDGVSLAALTAGAMPPPEAATAIAEFLFSGPELRGARTDHDMLVLDVEANRHRLFDLDADPGERTDVADRRPERVAELRRTLDETDARAAPGLYLFVRAGWERQRVRVTLLSPMGGFGDTALRRAKPGDDVTTSADRRVVTATFDLDPSGEGGVRVGMQDASASVTISSVTVNDRPLPSVALIVGDVPASSGSLPRTVSPSQATIGRAAPPPFSQHVVLALQVVPPRAPATLRLDPQTAEHLRALGYAQ